MCVELIVSHETATLGDIGASAPDDSGFALLQRVAIEIACEKREQAISAVGSVRFTHLLLTIAGWLGCASWRSAIDKSKNHKFDASLPSFAEKCLAHEQRRLLRHGKNLRSAGPKTCHKTRIAAKEMRYKAEFFRALYSKKNVDEYINSLAALQEKLGFSNDRVVADRLLQELSAGRADLHAGIGFARGYLASTVERKDSKSWKRFASMELPAQK
jgi:triphosphatase